MEVMKHLAITVGVAVGLFGFTQIARAQSAVDEARAHFKSGTELYDENNFRAALVEFQRAYELAPSYKILFNIGQVEMELADYAGALKAYTRYLREGGPDISAPRAAEVKQEIERLRGRVGRLTVQTAAGAEVLIDDVSAGFAPLPEPVPVNSGRHQVSIHISGRDPLNRVVDVAGQQDLTVALGNDLAVAKAAGPAAPSGPPSKVPMYIAWTATGGFAITAAVFGFMARSDADQLSKLRNTFPVTKSQLDDQASKVSSHSAYADGFAIAAVVAGGVGLYLTLTLPHAAETKHVELRVSPTGAYVAGQF